MSGDLAQAIQGYVEGELLAGRSITPDQDLLLTGMLDSLAVMSLVAHIEKTAQITVRPEHVTIENFVSIDAIAAYIERCRAT